MGVHAPLAAAHALEVLELALREAVALRHNYIGTEHLLLSLVRGRDRVVADALALMLSGRLYRDGVVRTGARVKVRDALRAG